MVKNHINMPGLICSFHDQNYSVHDFHVKMKKSADFYAENATITSNVLHNITLWSWYTNVSVWPCDHVCDVINVSFDDVKNVF